MEVVVVAELPFSRGQDRILRLPSQASRNRYASKGCKMRCSCRNDRYELHCFWRRQLRTVRSRCCPALLAQAPGRPTTQPQPQQLRWQGCEVSLFIYPFRHFGRCHRDFVHATLQRSWIQNPLPYQYITVLFSGAIDDQSSRNSAKSCGGSATTDWTKIQHCRAVVAAFCRLPATVMLAFKIREPCSSQIQRKQWTNSPKKHCRLALRAKCARHIWTTP